MTPRYARLQRRRLAAAALFAHGARTADVARALAVTWRTAHRWRQILNTRGLDGLRSQRTGGPSRLLDHKQRRRLRGLLRNGARRYGFPDDTWTLSRIQSLVERIFGISCSKVSIWRILRESPSTSHIAMRR